MAKLRIKPEAVKARALGFALAELSHDELCYRLAGLTIVNEELSSITMKAMEEASSQSYASGFAVSLFKALTPLLDQGKRFTEGRKPGTGSPVRKAIAKLLKANPLLKTPAIWEILKSKPPRNHHFLDNRLGKYIKGPNSANMNYERFCNVCSEERKRQKSRVSKAVN
jgi:hypothetical protein